MQAKLTALFDAAEQRRLYSSLQQHGLAGRTVLAQLRSQRGRYAMAWMDAPHMPISTIAMATMLMVSLCIDGWRVDGAGCPFAGCHASDATCVHAMGCPKQHLRGHNAVHTAQKRCLQQLLRRYASPRIGNEDASVFTTTDRRADTVVYPGGLALSHDQKLRNRGAIIDTTVRAPTCGVYLAGAAHSASSQDGFAAEAAEHDKVRHHAGRFVQARWAFVPFVQESFGRFGRQAASFIKAVATHAAGRGGGSQRQLLVRAAHIGKDMRMQLSVSLAREEAERIMAYVRGAALLGRHAHPVSSLLAHARA